MTPRTLPFAILGGAALIVAAMFALRSQPEQRPREVVAPLVRAEQVTPAPYQFAVRAHGTVAPRSETELVPQVTGEVVWVSPSLAVGGFFERGEALVRVDEADYVADLESARAAVARAESEFRRARKERERQRRLATRSAASESRIDDAENEYRVADASLRESRARLGRAERDLERTELRAPYDGRVRSESVDLGQFVSRGVPIASLYAVDYVEVRLPLPDRELAFLDLSLTRPPRAPSAPAGPESSPSSSDSPGAGDPTAAPDPGPTAEPQASAAAQEAALPPSPAGPPVLLRAEFAGADHTWQGAVVRTEGELDPKSRMVHVVARVADPYGRESNGATPATAERPPLSVGLFVEAEIRGRRIASATVLPRSALREGQQVYVIDADDRLRFRSVEVLRTEGDRVVIGDGLRRGERVCTSSLAAAVDGMRVRVVDDPRRVEAAASPAEAPPLAKVAP